VRSQRELDSQVIPWLGWKEVTPHLDESDWMSSYAGSHSAFSECRLPFSVIHINRVHRAVRDLCKRRCSLCIESSHCLCSGDPEPSIRYTSVFNILGLQSQLVKFGPQLYQALHTLVLWLCYLLPSADVGDVLLEFSVCPGGALHPVAHTGSARATPHSEHEQVQHRTMSTHTTVCTATEPPTREMCVT